MYLSSWGEHEILAARQPLAVLALTANMSSTEIFYPWWLVEILELVQHRPAASLEKV